MPKVSSLTQQLLFAYRPVSISKKEKRPNFYPHVLTLQFEGLMKRYPKSEGKKSLKSLHRQLELSFYENESSAEKEDGPLVMKPNDPFTNLVQ